jgi:hypothetical protein
MAYGGFRDYKRRKKAFMIENKKIALTICPAYFGIRVTGPLQN